MHGYAQTNLQLYVQLDAAEWTESQLGLAARAYELALDVCGTSCRPNGKPFLCHLVGTASILVSHGASAHEVVCGLVHSVYTHGAFGNAPPGMTAAKREIVRRAVGDECEALVAAYTQLRWKPDAVAQLVDGLDSLTAMERGAIRVRLANELEDHLDLGMRFSLKAKVGSADVDGPLPILAGGLVGEEFARELAAAFAANETATVPSVLVRAERRSFRPGVEARTERAR